MYCILTGFFKLRVVEITMHVLIYVFGMCLNIAILTVTI